MPSVRRRSIRKISSSSIQISKRGHICPFASIPIFPPLYVYSFKTMFIYAPSLLFLFPPTICLSSFAYLDTNPARTCSSGSAEARRPLLRPRRCRSCSARVEVRGVVPPQIWKSKCGLGSYPGKQTGKDI